MLNSIGQNISIPTDLLLLACPLVTDRRMSKPTTMIVNFSISPFRSGGFCLIHIEAVLASVSRLRIVLSFSGTDPFHYKIHFLYCAALILKSTSSDSRVTSQLSFDYCMHTVSFPIFYFHPVCMLIFKDYLLEAENSWVLFVHLV